METQIVLFGAGKIGREYSNELENMGIRILCYADNDQNKWGKIWNGKPVVSPENLRKLEGLQIVVSCAELGVIIRQLWRMGLGLSSTSMELLRCRAMSERTGLSVLDSGKSWLFIIDNVTGTWGGAEDWSHSVGLKLRENGKEVFIL